MRDDPNNGCKGDYPVMGLAQNWPKTAKSSWHCPFNVGKHRPKGPKYLTIQKRIHTVDKPIRYWLLSQIAHVTQIIVWLAPWVGKMNQILCCERTRRSCLAWAGLPTVSRNKNFFESDIINPLLTTEDCLVKIAGYWQRSFFMTSLLVNNPYSYMCAISRWSSAYVYW